MPTNKTVSPTTYKLTVERIIRKYEDTIVIADVSLPQYVNYPTDSPQYERYLFHKISKEHAEVMLDMIHKYIKS